jgi:hypothetical protein
MKTSKKTNSIRTVRHITVFSVNWEFPQSHKKSVFKSVPESRFSIKKYVESDFLSFAGQGSKFSPILMFCIIIYVIASLFLPANETLYSFRHGC